MSKLPSTNDEGDSGRFGSSDRLSVHLPFAIDDFASVNACFASCKGAFRESARTALTASREVRIVEIWTYCFVRRYFIGKCLRDAATTPSDLESMIDKAYVKIRNGRGKVRTDRYAGWVCVVCKNTFLNYARGRRLFVSLDESGIGDLFSGVGPSSAAMDDLGRESSLIPQGGGLVAEPETDLDRDGELARKAVIAAIDRLPNYLREIAHLKIVEGLRYEELSERLDRPVPVLRSYVHRIVLKLRKDRTLVEFFGESG